MNKVLITLCILIASCQGISQEKNAPIVKEAKQKKTFAFIKTKKEWKQQLTNTQYAILREAATENSFSSDLLENKEKGVYTCAGCSTPLFKSKNKFNSGTGWPSFDQEIKGSVNYDIDYKIGYKRTEEHCATCGGHLGHVFEDGPRKTTGLRHCINGAILKFIPEK